MSHDATKNLNDVMRKYDRESNTRAWEGKPKIAVQAYLAAFAIFEVYVTLFGTMLDEVRLTSFVGGLLIAGFLIFPSHKHEFRVNYVPWYDWVIMALGAVSFFYFCFNANTIVQQLPALKTYEVILGVIGILALFELCRRSTGVPIMIVHVSGGEAVEQIRWARNKGLSIFAETCTQYISLTADDLKGLNMDESGSKYVCSPPPRDHAPARAAKAKQCAARFPDCAPLFAAIFSYPFTAPMVMPFTK